MINQKIFDSLDKKLRRDLVIGIIVMLVMGIVAVAGWGFYNQGQWESCTKNYTEYAIELERRTTEKYERDKKYNDSVNAATQKELKEAKEAKAEIEKQLIELKQR